MTPVEFQFNYPDGEPIANAEFVIKLPRSGFIDAVDGVIMPATLVFTTDALGMAVVSLAPSSSVYTVRMSAPLEEGDDGLCHRGINYKFYVPNTTEMVRAQDLFLAPPPNSEPWDETAIRELTEAKIVAVNAAETATAAADVATDAATRAEAAADGIDEDADRAELARDAAIAAATESQGSADAAALSATTASDAATQTGLDAAQVAADTLIVVAAKDEVLVNAGDATDAAERAEASAVRASVSEGAADGSATAAGLSETSAAESATAAEAAKDIALAQATVSTDAAAAAAASETSAEQSAADALASKNSATASATTATTKASEATESALAALNSQDAAKTSETNAKASETAALPAIAAALRYCGSVAVAPTTRVNGTALQPGDEYTNTTDTLRYSWNGTAWIALNGSVQQLEAELAGPNGPDKINRSAYFVGSIQELTTLPRRTGVNAVVASYHVAGASQATGGGLFIYDANRNKSAHDGMNIFSPTVPFSWGDFGQSYLYGVGETSPGGAGCWIRQKFSSDIFNAGARPNTNVTHSIRRAITSTGGAAILRGNFSLTPDVVTVSSYQFILGAGKGVTVVSLTADTTGWGVRNRGNYNKIANFWLQALPGSGSFNGSLIRVEHDNFVTYKQECADLYLKGVAGSSTGQGIHYYSDSDTGKGITFPIADNIDGWNLENVVYFSKILSGYIDSGIFTRIRGSICKFVVDMGVKGAGSSSFIGIHGRYDEGVTEGLIRIRGTRISIKECLMYDFASPYIFVEPEANGTMIGNSVLISQGSAVQDKGWGTSFIGSPVSCAPESSGGAGYGWLEQHDNCLGFDPGRNWNVTKTGTSNATYMGSVATLGPMMLLTAAGAAGSVSVLDYGSSYACNPYQQTKFSGFFWIPSSPANGRFEAGIYNSAGTSAVFLLADVTVNPNFVFVVKQPGVADVFIDTGKPVGTKRHAFGIIRTGTSGGLTLHFDCRLLATGVPFTDPNSLHQPRIRLTSLTASTANVYMNGITLRTTSDTYVTDWVGSLN